MTHFPTWSEWRKFRESNARKRAVRAALSGTGPDLPGSYAACPSTNPRAMKSAMKKGVVTKLPISEEEKVPNYSFDRWLQQAKEFGNDINQMRTGVEAEEKDLDDKKKAAEKDLDKEKSKPKEPPVKEKENDSDEGDSKDDPDTKKKTDAWKQLRMIHKDRASQFERGGKQKPDSSSDN